MSALSLKIIIDGGDVTRMIKFEPGMRVANAYPIIKEKVHHIGDEADYGLFLPSADDNLSGTWLEPHRTFEHYMLRDGDSLLLLKRSRILRVKMLDGVVKTLQVDESKAIGDIIHVVCGKIGITNHDEFGLCHEEVMQEEPKDPRPIVGTLTLKRKPQKEKDARMEQLSKKFKTDDNVEWLDQHKTLRELGVDDSETLLLKRRLFFSDRNVDVRDPKQLNMLYNEIKEAILEGKHPVDLEEAINLAAIQCQVNFGDFNEEKHKPGFIEDLKEYMPEEFDSTSNEKSILKTFRKHQGLSHLDAMHHYIKTARELPTYGVTFFLVKEKQKGKNKLVPRLLGINADSILRLDVHTKEILQTWPLTHVKMYHASKNDTFMLNFGDYSDKDYTVKTNDALRIRDILEGYIDVIRKKMLGNAGEHRSESGAIVQESVHASRGNMITHVNAGPNKMVEQSFVGPSKIIEYEQGSTGSQGTQVMTVQQLIITKRGSQQQQTIIGEAPMRSDISKDLMKKLNRLNSNAVQIVTLMTEPNPKNCKGIKTIMETIQEEMPSIESGIRESAAKQASEDQRRKLLNELEELMKICCLMGQDSQSDDLDAAKMENDAKRLADLTTQIVFSVDPRTQRRSQLLRSSRSSFIQDEKMEATLRRASFLTAAHGATNAADVALQDLDECYSGPTLSEQDLVRVEASAVDKLGKLNAAVALFLNAHADPKDIDYAAAVNSMNTIKELLPELVRDAKTLGSASDDQSRQELYDEIKSLCETTKKICSLTGCDDHGKLQEAANGYADVSGRLVYVFGSGNPRVNADRENEIMELAHQCGAAASELLQSANKLLSVGGPAVGAVDTAGVACAHAAKDLLTCAQITAPCITEAHCRSALSGAAGAMWTRAEQLALSWRPLVVEDQETAQELTKRSMLLAEALDKLKAAFANIEYRELRDDNELPSVSSRLRFMAGVSEAWDRIHEASRLLDEPIEVSQLSDKQINNLQDSISQRLGQINAAVASLMEVYFDPQSPDYEKAEQAMNTIAELKPYIIKDALTLLSTCDDASARDAMLNDIKAWSDGINDVCVNATSEDRRGLGDAAKNFALASKKLTFAFSPRARKAREQLMQELFSSTHEKAGNLVEETSGMADTIGGANGVKLRELGNAVQDSADSLKTTYMITSPTLDDPGCRSALTTTSDNLLLANDRVSDFANSLQDDETGCRVLSAKLQEQKASVITHVGDLNHAVHCLKDKLRVASLKIDEVRDEPEEPGYVMQRLKFMGRAAAVRRKVEQAQDILTISQPSDYKEMQPHEVKVLPGLLSHNLSEVNGAVASLIRDRDNQDFAAAEMALSIISDLHPSVVEDALALNATSKDEKDRIAQLKDIYTWCDAIKAVCDSAGYADLQDFAKHAGRYSESSNKLSFICKPQHMPGTHQNVRDRAFQAYYQAGKICEISQNHADHRPLEDAAIALNYTAMLTAPSLKEVKSRKVLLEASEVVATSADKLVTEIKSKSDQSNLDIAEKITPHKDILDSALEYIEDTCDLIEVQEANRSTLAAALSKLWKEFDRQKTPRPVSLNEDRRSRLRRNVEKGLNEINAAVACLIVSESDVDKPDYEAANVAVNKISNQVHDVFKDAVVLGMAEKNPEVLELVDSWKKALRSVCASLDGGKNKELDKAAQKYINCTDKLRAAVKIPAGESKVSKIMPLCIEACDRALAMIPDLEYQSREEANAMSSLAAAARALHTAALLTAPTIEESVSTKALTYSCDSLSRIAKHLVDVLKGGNPEVAAQKYINLQDLDQALEKLKGSLDDESSSPIKIQAQRLKFLNSASVAQDKALEMKMLLDQPASETKLSEQESKDAQEKLSRAIARINAELVSLIAAKSDSEKPDYVNADKSLGVVLELLPEVIKESRDLSTTCKDDAASDEFLKELRAWCDAIHAICASAQKEDNQELNESAAKMSDSLQKLRFVFGGNKNLVKEQQILQTSNTACDKARQMAYETNELIKSVQVIDVAPIKLRSNKLRTAARALHIATQLSLPTIYEVQSQQALLQSADEVTSSAQQLIQILSDTNEPVVRRHSEECQRHKVVMDNALDLLKSAVQAQDKGGKPSRPPSVPVKKSTLTGAATGAGAATGKRIRVVSHSDGRRASQDWLDNMRQDASIDLVSSPTAPAGLSHRDIEALNKRAEDERRNRNAFQRALDDAEQAILDAESKVEKVSSIKPTGQELEQEQKDVIQKQIESKLASAGITASKFMSSNHPDEVDYVNSAKAANALKELLPDIVKDVTILSNTRDRRYRNSLLDQIKALCEAARKLITTAKDNDEKFNQSAIEFGEKSAGLLYMVSPESRPAQEKMVIEEAKAIGESAIRIAEQGAGLAGAGPAGMGGSRALCDAGRTAAAKAAHLVYTAKLVAPYVHHQQSQNALITASHELSSELKNFTEQFKPYSSDPKLSSYVSKMYTESQNLEKLLEKFRHEIAAGKLVRRREVETVIVEDTALRQLATKILDIVQQRADCSNISDDKKKVINDYASHLRDAIRELDLANTRCKRAPMDLKRRRDLEIAVQNLQISVVLNSRATHHDQQGPMDKQVDLVEFVKDTSKEAEKLLSTLNKIESNQDKKQIDVVKEECRQITSDAFNILNPSEWQSEEDPLDSILSVEQFGRDCDNNVNRISSNIGMMKEKNYQNTLSEGLLPLRESCSVLQFAAKSASATAQGAALDETLSDLLDLEKRLDKILLPVEENVVGKESTPGADEVWWCGWHVARAAAGVARGGGGGAPPTKLPAALLALASTLRRCRIPTPVLKEYASKLVDLSKSLTATTGTRVAMWQPLSCPETQAILEEIQQELENPQILKGIRQDKCISVVSQDDVQKLLAPTAVVTKKEEDAKTSLHQIQQAASKLVSMCGTVTSGAHSQQALKRAAPAAFSAAVQLTGAARSHPYKVRSACAHADAVRACCDDSSRSVCGRLQRTDADGTAAVSAMPYQHCLDAIVDQQDVLNKLKSDEPMTRADFGSSVSLATEAVCNAAEYATQCAYLISISEGHEEAAKSGLVDTARLHKLSAATRDVCLRIIRTDDVDLAKDEENSLTKLSHDLNQAVKEGATICSDNSVKKELTEIGFQLEVTSAKLVEALNDQPTPDKITKCAIKLEDKLAVLNGIIENPKLMPEVGELSPETKTMADELLKDTKVLVSKTQGLLKEVKSKDDDEDPMTWVTFNVSRNSLLEAFDNLLRSVQRNGRRLQLIETPKEEENDEETESLEKSYLEIQEDRARQWLVMRRLPRAGHDAARIIIDLATLLAEDMKGPEKDELDNTIKEAEKLLDQCLKQHDKSAAGKLMEELHTLRRECGRGVAARVVEDFMATDVPLEDLETFLDAEKDEAKRRFLLEQKIAELLSQLGRTSRTARLAARVTTKHDQIEHCRQQTELLAPQLVRAAEDRAAKPHDTAVVERYRKLLDQYAGAMAAVRELCDQCIPPMDFVQTASETMARMREESSRHNNPQKCAYTSTAITRLATRAISASMSSGVARRDPELRAALADAADKLKLAAPPPAARPSKVPDWRDTTAEILRTTNEVESALGGENIFKKQREPDQPIYNAALNLHEAVREWSARDNEIVAVAKRMAVLMARLSEQMYSDRKRELIATSKSIVTKSREVAALANKLALECTDLRIRTNLLQVCEKIPTISGQLKMLTSVKATSLANHGGEDDREGMNMIVGNAQNLMSSVQEVVEAAAGASVKIASQRGLKWVRKKKY